ncbi:RNA polymerase-associated protein RapA [Thiocapsa bogorovii]|uniref:RNA polymerase-associated protein RapA n=1 Tax=Thiocapsa bogorovii TaxID=521689 RepID=UPI001E33B45E|nr:RNA polymerase-associated protein RapA [Thiocapsa bogorovii]UHD15158.1 RNA polymerase-associated protein RapA [Thiocapsa bogorovii]
MDRFVPGQRWLSETQGELGLGLVVAVDGRRVQIAYRATGEERIYALPDPPLVRLELTPGEHVRDREGRDLTILSVTRDAGLVTYRCEDLQGAVVALPESELDDRLRFNRPHQRLMSGRLDPDHWFDLRWRTWLLGMREADSPVRGLVGARVGLIPHQLEIAAEVARRDAPRVLLADEVGLGKTIEAGLILHRMLLTGRAHRVLVIAPEPLLHQWLVEMRRRFSLRFALFDQERFESISEPNPFLADQQVLCSLDWIIRSDAARRALVEGQWDVLVVDEAHHLDWSEAAASPEYRLVADLADRTPGVLLLTATPEQLGRAGHFGRLRLLDPQRFRDYASFLAEDASYVPVAAAAAHLLDGRTLGDADRALITSLLGDLDGLDTETILQRLLDRHGTGRVMFRNTRASIPGFPGRDLLSYPLPEPATYRALASDAAARFAPERLLGPAWSEIDPRVDWLIDLLRRLRPEKLLLICTAAETVLDLRDVLLRRAGIHAAVFHEEMEIRERDRAAAYFASAEDGTQILLCSEIGSEGRNFQFAHHLVLFDLPLDPDLLEQRIGRLDRIGQTRRVQIHVPYLAGGPGEVLFRWYAEGLNAFSAICPAAPAVYARLREDLIAALADPQGTDTLIAEARALSARMNGELAAGRDRLLELHSHRPERSAALVEAIERAEDDGDVADYLKRFWDGFGVEHESAPGHALVVRPGAHMLQETFPELPEEGLTLTFDRGAALSHEHWEFMTREHPMVLAAMELLTASDLGTSALTIVRDGRFKRASLLLEALYVAECQAPAHLEAGRFLPPTLLRLLIDESGDDLAETIPHEDLQGHCLNHNHKLARTLLESRGERLVSMIETGEHLARAAEVDLRRDAAARMQTLLGEELDRLRALSRVNPNVRPEEIAALEDRREQLAQALAKTELRLDALRLIVTG